MPSKQFNKLKPIKKRLFLRMAYREFALHSYEGASISQLVTNLKIAKGSIYQYFDNKKDLYDYLVEHAYIQMHHVVVKACPLPITTIKFDDWYKNYLLVHLKLLLTLPTYALLLMRNRIDSIGCANDIRKLETSFLVQSAVILNEHLTSERAYLLESLPLTLFKYVIQYEEIDLKEIINSNTRIEIASDKLLYFCDGFLKKSI